MREPVVVGAFPEPFLHGYDGKRRPAVGPLRSRARLQALARRSPARTPHPSRLSRDAAPADANVLPTVSGTARFTASLARSGRAGSPVRFVFAGDAKRARCATPTGSATGTRCREPGPRSRPPRRARRRRAARRATRWSSPRSPRCCSRSACARRGPALASTSPGRWSRPSRVFLLTPFVSHDGTHVLWRGRRCRCSARST